MMSEKEHFLKIWEMEYVTTLKVLKAYPENRQEYKPNEISKSAREMTWIFPAEEKSVVEGVIAGEINWANTPKPPATIHEAITEYEHIHREMVKKFQDTPEEELQKTMKFFVAPKKMGDVKRLDVLWMILMDQIHHRGQFSVYLRLVGAKVPSIYGPTADEKWD